MAMYVVEMPDDFNPDFCGLCYPHKCNGARGCPIPNAKKVEVVKTYDELKFKDKGIVIHNGKPVKLYAVEVEGDKK